MLDDVSLCIIVVVFPTLLGVVPLFSISSIYASPSGNLLFQSRN